MKDSKSYLLSAASGSVSPHRRLPGMTLSHWIARHAPASPFELHPVLRSSGDHSCTKLIRPARLVVIGVYLALFFAGAVARAQIASHTIQISNTADDGYYNENDGSGWNAVPQVGGADLVGSSSGITTAWTTGYRFPSTGVNSGDTIRSAYLQLVSSDGFASNATCGQPPCTNTNYTFRIYGVAQDDGPSFSNSAGNTPLDVPYTTSFVDYTSTGPGDVHGSCQGNNNGQNTCTHVIDVTNIVKEITSRPGWTSASAMRFVMLSTTPSTSNVYVGFEDSSANAGKAVTLLVNPPLPVIVSSGAWGTSPTAKYPATFPVGPFVYPGAQTLLMFLGDYYNFFGATVNQPTVSDNCGNTWNILAGPTDWPGRSYDMRSTVYYVENPASCPAGDTITITTNSTNSNGEPIFLHFLAIAGSNAAQTPVASAITSPSPGIYTTSATTNSITLPNVGQLVSWIFGDSDSSTTFTPQAGFITDVNSTPTYLTEASENVTPGPYTNEFTISPSDGWQTILIGVPATAGTTATPTVSVTASPTSIASTQALTVTVTLSGTPTPTGSVTLTGGGYTSGATTLSGGVATINVPAGSLNNGTDELTASYTPDSNSSPIYNGATGTTSVSVAEFTPTVTVAPSESNFLTTQPISVTVTVAGSTGDPTATGSVILSGGGYTSSPTALTGGSAIFYTSAGAFATGNDTLTASYSPDSTSSTTYTPATGAASVTVVYQAAATMTTPAPGSTLTSASTTFTWSAGSGGVTGYYLWIGTTSGADNLEQIGPLSGTSATVSLPTNGATIYVELITQINDSIYLNNNYTYTEFTKATPTVTVAPSLSAITTTQALSVKVTVSSGTGNPTPTGSVILSGGGYTSAATTITGGIATINIPANTLSAGNYTFTASYTPDSTSSSIYNSASGTAPSVVTVSLISPTVTVLPGVSSITTTQPLAVTVTVSGGTGNPTPTGTITLSGGTYTSASTTLINGTVAINIPANTLSVGSYTFKATYTPDATGSATYGSNSGTSLTSVTVSLATPTVTVTPGATAISITQALSVTITVNGGTGNPVPTGTVTLSGGSYTSAATSLSGGTVTINISAGTLSMGSYTFKATYTPDATSSPTYASASGTASSTVGVGLTTPTVALTPNSSSITTAQALTVTVAVSGGTGNPTPTGTVTLIGGSYTSAAASLSGGNATIVIPAFGLGAGGYTFKAVYAPDAASSSTYSSASGTASSVIVSLTTPTVAVTPSVSSIAISQPLSVTVTVGGGVGNPTPTGSVTLSGGSYSSAATALSGGTAIINIAANTLTAGSYTFTASYTPDATSSPYYGSASGTASSAVTATATTFTMSATQRPLLPVARSHRVSQRVRPTTMRVQ